MFGRAHRGDAGGHGGSIDPSGPPLPTLQTADCVEGRTIDLLHGLCDACRDEFEKMQARQFEIHSRRYSASIVVARLQSRSAFSGSRA
jgi:hypothetical protein